MKKKIFQLLVIVLFAIAGLTANAQGTNKSAPSSWRLAGNTGTNPNVNFFGTTDYQALAFRTNNIERMRLSQPGNLNILLNGSNVSLSTEGLLTLGNSTDFNMTIDDDDIQSRYNGHPGSLFLNNYGGTTVIGNIVSSDYGAEIYGNYYGVYAFAAGGKAVYGYDGGTGNGVFGYEAGNGEAVRGEAYGSGGWGGYFSSYQSIGMYAATGNSSSYAGFFEGDVYSTGTYFPSDQKLKQEIKEVTGAMDIINQLHPKQYLYRQDGNYKLMNLPKGNRYGLISEDVEKVLPNLVKNSKFDIDKATPSKPADPKNPSVQNDKKSGEIIDFKALNYTELIPIIIKGMQEQQEKIDKQQKVNEQQQLEIAGLKQMIQSITQNKSDVFSTPVTTYLSQNTPNPFTADTKIQCTVPPTAKIAQIIISAQDGKQLQSYNIRGGNSQITIHGSTLAAGSYLYSLVIDGKTLDTKIMILTK